MPMGRAGKVRGHPPRDALELPRSRSSNDDACSDVSTDSKKQRSRAQLTCETCWDPKYVRNLSFHIPCWNVWHGLCEECE